MSPTTEESVRRGGRWVEEPARAMDIRIDLLTARLCSLTIKEMIWMHARGTEFDLGPRQTWMDLRPHAVLGWSRGDKERIERGWEEMLKAAGIDSLKRWIDSPANTEACTLRRNAKMVWQAEQADKAD